MALINVKNGMKLTKLKLLEMFWRTGAEGIICVFKNCSCSLVELLPKVRLWEKRKAFDVFKHDRKKKILFLCQYTMDLY